jgi:chitinase
MRSATLIALLLGGGAVLGSPAGFKTGLAPNSIERKTSTAGKRAVGYYGNWVSLFNISVDKTDSFQDIYARDFLVTDIPSTQLSHIVYSFMNVNSSTGEV